MHKSLTQVLGQAMVKSAEPGLVKSTLGNWLGQTIKLADGRFWSGFYGADSASGQMVSVDSTLQLSTAWACVQIGRAHV